MPGTTVAGQEPLQPTGHQHCCLPCTQNPAGGGLSPAAIIGTYTPHTYMQHTLPCLLERAQLDRSCLILEVPTVWKYQQECCGPTCRTLLVAASARLLSSEAMPPTLMQHTYPFSPWKLSTPLQSYKLEQLLHHLATLYQVLEVHLCQLVSVLLLALGQLVAQCSRD